MKRIAVFTVFAAACGSDGNGHVPVNTTVTWLFDSYPALGISEGDSCNDLGVDKVQIDLTGPEPATMTGSCTDRQVVFLDLVPGAYAAAVTPLDVNGTTLVKTPVALTVNAGETNSMTQVNVPWDAWTTAYTGSFYFKIAWGGSDCAAASPPVDTQTVTLAENGTPTALKSDDGTKLDGTQAEPCRAGAKAITLVAQMPFGPATIQIIGKDSGGLVQYKHQFDTFVGAGISNPTIVYDVPGPPDAPLPDAMPADAMPDAN